MNDLLPPEAKKRIFECEKWKLDKLDLSNLGITKIDLERINLNHLKELNLGNNNLNSFPSGIQYLTNLKVLNLINNEIKLIPSYINNLSNLVQLGLSSNKIQHLTQNLFSLKKLQVLGINNNIISKIPDAIGRLDNLIVLGLKGNKIKRIPEEISQLNKLITIYLENNPIEFPPPEIVFSNQQLANIKQFYNEFNEAKEFDYLYELKLLIVGEPRVGKTSISKSLAKEKFSLSKIKSTEGIDISLWSISKNDFSSDSIFKKNIYYKLDNKEDFRVNIWDFGGQEIYHATHQFFLTKRSVYLLVTEARKEYKHDDFFYWLNIIRVLGNNSPVLIILNKCDLTTKLFPINEYTKAFPNIVDFKKVSCLPKYNHTINSLKEDLKVIFSNKNLLPHIGSKLPKVWIDIRKQLEDLKDSGNDFITKKEYLDICKSKDIDEKKGLWLSDFFHDLGILLHFQEEIDLEDIVILNHKWATTGVYNVLDNQKIITNFGVFDNKDLKNIWSDKKYLSKRRELLALMNKFELCFKLDDGSFLAPQLLPEDEVVYDIISITKEKKISISNTISFEYHYKFLPKGILSRLIVKLSSHIFKNFYWKYGVLVTFNDSIGIVKENYFERKITLTLYGENRKELLGIIMAGVKGINTTFNHLEVDEYIPCLNCISTNQDKIHYFKLSGLKKRLKNSINEIQCDECYKRFEVNQILNGVFTSENTIKKIFQYIESDKLKIAIEVLDSIFYSKSDFDLQKEFIAWKNKYYTLINNQRKGIIKYEDFTIEKNKLINSLLSLVHEIYM